MNRSGTVIFFAITVNDLFLSICLDDDSFENLILKKWYAQKIKGWLKTEYTGNDTPLIPIPLIKGIDGSVSRSPNKVNYSTLNGKRMITERQPGNEIIIKVSERIMEYFIIILKIKQKITVNQIFWIN